MKSSLKKHRRYLFVKYLGQEGENISDKEIESKLNLYLEKSLGADGLLECSPRIISCIGGEIILKCSRGCEDKLCAWLALSHKMDSKRARFWVKRVSGTIKTIREREKIVRERKKI